MLSKLTTLIFVVNRFVFSVILVSFLFLQQEMKAQVKNDDSGLFEIGTLPKMVEVEINDHFLEQIDSVIQLSKAQKNLQQEVKSTHYKAFVLVQQKKLEKAKETYLEVLQVLGNSENHLTKVKVLAGLGEIAALEGMTMEAQDYFTKAIDLAKEHQNASGMNWILFHSGENYIPAYTLSEAELEQLQLFASYYLYSSPQRSLAASKWLINQSGEHKEYALEGYIFSGLIYRDWGQFDKSLAQFFAAQKNGEQYSFGERSKYSPLLNIAAVYDMQGQHEKSLETIKKVVVDATKDNDDWALAYALKDLGIMYMQTGKYVEAAEYLLRCIPMMQRIENQRGLGVCYSNLVNCYIEMGVYDKASETIEKALTLLKASNYDQLYASTLLSKALLFKKLGNWEAFKSTTEESLVKLKHLNSLEHILLAYSQLLDYYEYKGDISNVQKYVDSAFTTHEIYYEQSRLRESEKQKVRYESEKKEIQLAIQKKLNTALSAENELYKSLQKTLFFVLLLSSVILVLLFNRYKLRNRLAGEKERSDRAEKKQLTEEMNHKQRELASMTLQMVKKNELLQDLSQNIKKLEHQTGDESKKEVKKLKQMIQSQNRLDQDWSNFKIHFDGVHPNFYDHLREIVNNLTSQDERHCCYIKMGLSTKEIAQLMNISSSSVQMARYRLKKKLGLSKKDNIYSFIHNL